MQFLDLCGMMEPDETTHPRSFPVINLFYGTDMTASALYDLVISGCIETENPPSLLANFSGYETLHKENCIRIRNIPESALASAIGNQAELSEQLDIAAIPAGLSLKNFRCAFFDMDSTLICNECIDELAALWGVGDQIAAITERSMRGELDFEQSLRERVALLAGAPSDIIEQASLKLQPTPGAKETLQLMHRAGVSTYILSGGFTQFAQMVSDDYGMTNFVCNSLVIKNGKLTGEVTGPAGGKILDRSGKRRALEVIARLHDCELSQCIAGGDGANDLEMIGAAGFGFAYHAKPIVAQAAPYRVKYGTFQVVSDWFMESWQH